MGRLSGIGDDPSVVSADLIDRIYASALEPSRHDELMRLWQHHVAASPPKHAADEDGHGVASGATAPSGDLRRHFERAFSILERLGNPERDLSSVEALIENGARPSMLVAPTGRIVAANEPARALLDVAVDDAIDQLPFDVDGLRNVRLALAQMATQAPSRLLAVARITAPDRELDLVLALSRAQRQHEAPPLGILTVADLTLSLRIGEVLMRAFGLTETECDVARALVSGDSARQIAVARNRSLETVRTQIKAVLRKVNVHSRSELIRLTAALVQFDLHAG